MNGLDNRQEMHRPFIRVLSHHQPTRPKAAGGFAACDARSRAGHRDGCQIGTGEAKRLHLLHVLHVCFWL